MRKEALIQIIATQVDPENREDRMDFITKGAYYLKGDSYYIIYRESEVTGLEGVTTNLKVESNKVSLNRMGKVDYKQIFQLGQLHNSNYVTPYGTFNLSVLTDEMDINLTENGGHINLKYNLFADNYLVSTNTLRITIKEDTPQ